MPASVFGAEITVNEEITNAQTQPQVILLADGRFLFVWYSTDLDVDGTSLGGVAARVGTLQPDGSMVWAAAGEFTVNVNTQNAQETPQATLLSDGRVLITYSSNAVATDGNGYGVAARIGSIQADGSIVWAAAGEFTVNEEVTSNQYDQQVTLLKDGRVLITFTSQDGDVDGDSLAIAARVGTVQMNGSIAWASPNEITVNLEGQGLQQQPQVTVLGDGRVLFVWTTSDTTIDPDIGIAARVGEVQADGSITWAVAGEFRVNEGGALYQTGAQVAVLQDGRVVFAWANDANGGISARVGSIQADGSITWATGDITVHQENAGSQFEPQLIVLADGRVLFTWRSNDPDVDGSGYGVAARIGDVQADGTIVWQSEGEINLNQEVTNDQINAQALALADGRVLVVWSSLDTDVDGNGYGIAGRLMLFNAPTDAQDDSFDISETGAIADADLFADNGSGVDTEGDGEAFTVTAANGSALNVGTPFVSGLGATVTLQSNGTFGYDPNGAFSLRFGQSVVDTLTYRIDDGFGGTSTATVSITINSAGESFVGTGDVDDFAGTAYGDLITGDVRGDTLSGEAGRDQIFGGAGDDSLFGGAGADLLDGGLDADQVHGGAGADELYGRSGNDTIYGDEDYDTLEGSNGIDTLNGGSGADSLWGGAGADTYVFNTALGGGNVDTIVSFSVAEDFIQLSASIFGALSGDFFVIGTAATSADHRIVYDATAGALYFDADGDGAGAAVQFATLSIGLTGLSESNFLGGP